MTQMRSQSEQGVFVQSPHGVFDSPSTIFGDVVIALIDESSPYRSQDGRNVILFAEDRELLRASVVGRINRREQDVEKPSTFPATPRPLLIHVGRLDGIPDDVIGDLSIDDPPLTLNTITVVGSRVPPIGPDIIFDSFVDLVTSNETGQSGSLFSIQTTIIRSVTFLLDDSGSTTFEDLIDDVNEVIARLERLRFSRKRIGDPSPDRNKIILDREVRIKVVGFANERWLLHMSNELEKTVGSILP